MTERDQTRRRGRGVDGKGRDGMEREGTGREGRDSMERDRKGCGEGRERAEGLDGVVRDWTVWRETEWHEEGQNGMEKDGTGRNGNLKEERRGSVKTEGGRWNGEGPDGMEDMMERRGTRRNVGTQDRTEGDQMERSGIR